MASLKSAGGVLVSGARNSQLDVARGLGILLVVVGHSGLVNTSHGEAYEAIYSFHVPLFFVLAGIFFKAEPGLWPFMLLRADRLLKPYVATLLIFAVGIVGAAPWTLSNYLLATFYGSGRMMPIGPLWFLPHLFLLSIAAWLLLRNGRILAWPPATRLLLAVLVLAAGVLLMQGASTLTISQLSLGRVSGDLGQRTPGLPYGADLLGVTLGYFLLGLFARNYILKRSQSLPITFLALMAFVAIHVFTDITMDINTRRYDSILLSTLAALAGSQMVFGLAGSPLSDLWVGRLLAYYGRHSLVVLCFHLPVSLFVSRRLDMLGWSHAAVDATALGLTVLVCGLVAAAITRSPARRLYEPVLQHKAAAASSKGRLHVSPSAH